MTTVRIDDWARIEPTLLESIESATEVYIGTYRLSFWDDSAYIDALDACTAIAFEMIIGHQAGDADDAADELRNIIGCLPAGAKTRLLPKFHAKYCVTIGKFERTAFFGSSNFGNSASMNLGCISTRTIDTDSILRFHKSAWGYRPPRLEQVRKLLTKEFPACE